MDRIEKNIDIPPSFVSTFLLMLHSGVPPAAITFLPFRTPDYHWQTLVGRVKADPPPEWRSPLLKLETADGTVDSFIPWQTEWWVDGARWRARALWYPGTRAELSIGGFSPSQRISIDELGQARQALKAFGALLKAGRPTKVDAEAIRRAAAQLDQEKGSTIDRYGMAGVLGISPRTLDRYRGDGGRTWYAELV